MHQDLIGGVTVLGADNIRTFLERPVIISHGLLADTDTGKIASLDPWRLLVVAKQAKLDGIYMLRATLHLTLNVNAVRFQTGRYILYHLPTGGADSLLPGYTVKLKLHTTHLTAITQLPHVEIDIATQTHVELDLPFNMVFPYMDTRVATRIDFGDVFLNPYVPLAAGAGDATAGYTLWASFRDIELSGPTVTQSAGDFSAREQKRAGIGPVQGVFDKVAKATTILGELPLIGAGAKTVSWGASVLGRAASVFGWSKPVSLKVPEFVVPRPLAYLGVSDQLSTAQPLGLVSTNAVVSSPGNSGTNVDEMSFDFVKSIYAYYTQFMWTPENALGTSLLTMGVGPQVFTNTFHLGSIDVPVCFLSRFFHKWRGGLKFRFKIVKNEFYSGRLSVHFQPSFLAAAVSNTYTEYEYCSRVIVDIRETSEFEVCVPYISPAMYTLCSESIGWLRVSVIDPLVAPDSVPQSIQVIVEVAGQPDFEVMQPIAWTAEPYALAVMQSDYQAYPCHDLGVQTNTGSLEPAKVAAGEKAESFRQLLKLFRVSQASSGSVVSVASGDLLNIAPFIFTVAMQITSNVTPVVRSAYMCDNLTLISMLYSMCTGGVRVTAVPAVPCADSTFCVGLSPIHGDVDVVTTVLADHQIYRANIRAPINYNIERYMDIQVPSYQLTVGRAIAGQIASTATGATFSLTWSQAVKTSLWSSTYMNNDGVTHNYTVARQAADDYNCFGFLSTYPYVTSYY
jgi:hypothetical protein